MSVARRTVFYVSGFDPRGAMHYHGLYRAEAEKQARVNGMAIKVGPRRRAAAQESRWTAATADTVTEYSFLHWDDIIRARWPRGTWSTYWDTARYAMAFLRRGVFRMLARHARSTFVTAIYAPALLLLVLLASAGLGAAVALAAWPWLGAMAILPGLLPLALFYFARPVLEKMNAFWLGRGCAFLADRGAGRTPDAEARCALFADKIIAAVRSGENGEVLLVSHSVGAHLAVTALALALARDPGIAKAAGTALAHLTIGQTVAMTGCQPRAQWFRDQLAAVAAADAPTWIDVTAPADNTSLPLTDPLTASGMARQAQPKLVSARFVKLFTPEGYARLKRDFLRRHFQYLMAAELPGGYDYFAITAGPLTLAERYRDQPGVNAAREPLDTRS